MRLSPFVVLLLFSSPSFVAGAIEVVDVSFRTVTTPGQPGAWHESVIELRYNADRARYSGPVTVELTLSWARGATSVDDFSIYFARCELAGLPEGERQRVPFYLPPAIADRTAFTEEPDFWSVQVVERGQRPVSARGTRLASRSDRVAAALPGRVPNEEGFLQPVYLTPFWTAPGFREDVPAFLRKETR